MPTLPCGKASPEFTAIDVMLNGLYRPVRGAKVEGESHNQTGEEWTI
jgi:hypothetical protein